METTPTTKETAMQVKVFGPNLSSTGQRKGQFHVHAADCGDCAKYGPGKPMGGEDNGWEIEASSRKDIVLDIYPAGDFDYDADTEWQGMDDLFVAPCVKLPSERKAS